MAMQGDLHDMAVADLIQHNCQDRKTARLVLDHNGKQATLFFKEGNVAHASLGDLQGEEVVYHVLDWQDGMFSLELGQDAPATTITRSWSGLLLEGARRLDEANADDTNGHAVVPEPAPPPRRKANPLEKALVDILAEASDIEGAAIVGVDGLVYAAHVPQHTLDETMVGASSAAILGLSKRSAAQLKRGKFKQVLIQGHEGNIIVADLKDDTLLLGLTSNAVNLGLVFAEMRDIAGALRSLV